MNIFEYLCIHEQGPERDERSFAGTTSHLSFGFTICELTLIPLFYLGNLI